MAGRPPAPRYTQLRTATRPDPDRGQGSQTITVEQSDSDRDNDDRGEGTSAGVLKLRGGPSHGQRVAWVDGTVDNEFLNRKKSKICCIYHKPKRKTYEDPFADSSSSDSSESESDSEGDTGVGDQDSCCSCEEEDNVAQNCEECKTAATNGEDSSIDSKAEQTASNAVDLPKQKETTTEQTENGEPTNLRHDGQHHHHHHPNQKHRHKHRKSKQADGEPRKPKPNAYEHQPDYSKKKHKSKTKKGGSSTMTVTQEEESKEA